MYTHKKKQALSGFIIADIYLQYMHMFDTSDTAHMLFTEQKSSQKCTFPKILISKKRLQTYCQ